MFGRAWIDRGIPLLLTGAGFPCLAAAGNLPVYGGSKLKHCVHLLGHLFVLTQVTASCVPMISLETRRRCGVCTLHECVGHNSRFFACTLLFLWKLTVSVYH